jgi:hypothetical protein
VALKKILIINIFNNKIEAALTQDFRIKAISAPYLKKKILK